MIKAVLAIPTLLVIAILSWGSIGLAQLPKQPAEITGHIIIAKQVTSTGWMNMPMEDVPQNYLFWIMQVSVKNESYSDDIVVGWEEFLGQSGWQLINNDPNYPKGKYPIYWLDLSSDLQLQKGGSGQFSVLFAVPPVSNFNYVTLVYVGRLPNLDANSTANLILDATVSSYNWDTKTITDPNYKPPKSFPKYLLAFIILAAVIVVFWGFSRLRKWISTEAADESKIFNAESREFKADRSKIEDLGQWQEQKRLSEEEKVESHGDEGQETLTPSQTYEAVIQEFIVKNIGLLESGLQVIEQHRKIPKDNKIIGEIDILCRDMNGNYVVVELKRGVATREVIGQIAQYLGWVEENLPTGKKARGIIVASEMDKKLDYAIKFFRDSGSQIEIKLFRGLAPIEGNMKYCDNCQKLIPKSANICSHCGHKLWM